MNHIHGYFKMRNLPFKMEMRLRRVYASIKRRYLIWQMERDFKRLQKTLIGKSNQAGRRLI